MSHLDAARRAAGLDWLLAACRGWLVPGRVRVGARGEPDWEVAGRLAYLHNLEPLLHALLEDGRLAPAAVPGTLAERWQTVHYQNFVFNAELLEILARFLTRCRERALPAVVFKGPVTAARAYGGPALRIMHDIDLLCRERDLEALAGVARELGFDAGAENSVYHASFSHRELELGIELHFELYGFLARRSRLLESVLARPDLVPLEELRIPSPAPEVGLLLEVAHLVNHDFRVHLRSLVDFAALLSRAPFERQLLETLLNRHDLRGEFELAAALVTELFRLPVAAGLAGSRTPAAVLRRQVLDHLRAPEEARARSALAEAAARPGLPAALRYALRLLFPPLSHLRAIRGTDSSARALLHLPRHLAATLGRGLRNWRGRGLAALGPGSDSVKRRAFARRLPGAGA